MRRNKQWVALQIVYGAVIDEIEKLFTAQGYAFMPIKGAYLIRSGLSGQISERCMRDIDLLVPERQFQEICSWFEALENVAPQKICAEFERPSLYYFSGIPVCIELHRLINSSARFLLPNEVLFNRGVVGDTSCIFPDPVDALLIHICHKMIHVIDGFEDQFYWEIALLARQNGFSWKMFWSRVESTGIVGFIWCVLYKYEKLFNAKCQLPRTPSLYAFLLSRCGIFMRCKNASLRRLFFEVPFVRDLIGMVVYTRTRR